MEVLTILTDAHDPHPLGGVRHMTSEVLGSARSSAGTDIEGVYRSGSIAPHRPSPSVGVGVSAIIVTVVVMRMIMAIGSIGADHHNGW